MRGVITSHRDLKLSWNCWATRGSVIVECLTQKGLKKMVGLAQRLALHCAEALVSCHQCSESFLHWKRWNWNLELFQFLQIDGWLCRSPCPAVGLGFYNGELHH